MDLLTTSTFDNHDLVLGIVVLVCFSPSIIAWLVSIAGVSATSISTAAVDDISDGIQSLASPTVRPSIRLTVHSPFGQRKVLPFLVLGTLCATWMALLAGSVSNPYPTREDVTKATVAWCEALLMFIGSLNIAMQVVVTIARRGTCYKYTCCGRVKDKLVNQREGESERKSEEESSDRIENELKPAIEMETVEPVETGSADSIGGRDGGTMDNGLTMATVNRFSFPMALAFGIVFGGGLFSIRRKLSLNHLMVVVVGKQIDKALMHHQNVSFFSLP